MDEIWEKIKKQDSSISEKVKKFPCYKTGMQTEKIADLMEKMCEQYKLQKQCDENEK